MKTSTKIILAFIAVVVIALLITTIVIAEKNGLTVGQQLSQWFTFEKPPVDGETLEQGAEAVALVA